MTEDIRFVSIAHALSDPTRYMVMAELVSGSKSCSELREHVNVAQPTLSHHLNVLYEAGLVRRIPKGRWHDYEANAETLEWFTEHSRSLLPMERDSRMPARQGILGRFECASRFVEYMSRGPRTWCRKTMSEVCQMDRASGSAGRSTLSDWTARGCTVPSGMWMPAGLYVAVGLVVHGPSMYEQP